MTDQATHTDQSQRLFALVVSDDTTISLSLSHLFGELLGRYAVVCADAKAALQHLHDGAVPQIAIIDYRANTREARELTETTSAKFPSVTILALAEFDDTYSSEEAFLCGADDVIYPNFSHRELALRIRTRLGARNDASFDIHPKNSVDWDAVGFVATRAHLTAVETQIASLLLSKSGEIVSRNELSNAIDRRPWSYGDRKFDVHVAKICKKLNSTFGGQIEVRTIRSEGYQLKLTDGPLQ